MKAKKIYTVFTHIIWVRSLQVNCYVYFPAQLCCSSLNRVTIPLSSRLAGQKNKRIT
jgi:hypothetical protein